MPVPRRKVRSALPTVTRLRLNCWLTSVCDNPSASSSYAAQRSLSLSNSVSDRRSVRRSRTSFWLFSFRKAPGSLSCCECNVEKISAARKSRAKKRFAFGGRISTEEPENSLWVPPGNITEAPCQPKQTYSATHREPCQIDVARLTSQVYTCIYLDLELHVNHPKGLFAVPQNSLLIAGHSERLCPEHRVAARKSEESLAHQRDPSLA